MSKSKKPGKRQNVKNLGDVTLNDFANSSVAKTRTKKSTTNVTQVIKKELGSESEKTWEDRVEDFEGDFDFVQEENEDGTISYVMKKIEPRRRKKTISDEESFISAEGNDYPLDVWFLISEYIRPEDVGRFAGICKTSFAVVCTAKFWFSIYKRNYKSVPTLPERLQPECMWRLYGVRTSVIRALHYMYSPFTERVSSITNTIEHPDVLIKRQCVSMWLQNQTKYWVYFFKLKENCTNTLSHHNGSRKPDLIEMLEDVSANPDDQCRILQVTCKDFIPVPTVLGFTLVSVSVNLSQGFRHHRLQLYFGSGLNTSPSVVGGSGYPVVHLDPVISYKVLDWWHPLYPCTQPLESLLNKEDRPYILKSEQSEVVRC